MSKRCSRCKRTKPRSEFYNDRSKGDGLGYWCKKCRAEYAKSPRGRMSQARARVKHPDRGRAHRAVQRAVANNKISHVSTQKCEACGGQAKHYHHYLGYAKKHWLDIMPLCRKCHIKSHSDPRITNQKNRKEVISMINDSEFKGRKSLRIIFDRSQIEIIDHVSESHGDSGRSAAVRHIVEQYAAMMGGQFDFAGPEPQEVAAG